MRFLLIIVTVWAGEGFAAETFTVATFNVENYFLKKFGTRKVKPEGSRAKVAEAILAIAPDVLALQEMGRRAALEELRGRLADGGLKYTHVGWVVGPDPAIHIAVLSRFPMKMVAHTNVMYTLDRRRFQVSRGFGEARVRVNDNYEFTLFVGHLKSKRPVGIASEAEMRLAEARELRKLVAARLVAEPEANVLLTGDFNDMPNAPPIRTLISRARPQLRDLRPFERRAPEGERRVSWTYFYAKEDSFNRFDYILASKGMVAELERKGTFVHMMAGWGEASDHRPVVARFWAENR